MKGEKKSQQNNKELNNSGKKIPNKLSLLSEIAWPSIKERWGNIYVRLGKHTHTHTER